MSATELNRKAIVEHRVGNSNLEPISLGSQPAALNVQPAAASPAPAELSPHSSDLSPKPSALHGTGWRVVLPAVLLIVVALVQIALTRTAELGPWKGGGFGMFATIDGAPFRHVRVFVEGPGRSEELEIAPSQEFAASRVQLFPSDAMMSSLGRAVIAREQRYGRPVQTVRLEVWRTEFNPSLEATELPLRVFTLYADQTSDDSR